MTKKNRKKKPKATRGQLALIGVLSVVLVGVIVMQLPDSPDHKPRKSAGKPHKMLASLAVGEQSAVETDKEVVVREWPKLSLSDVEKLDPFAAPAWYQATLALDTQTEQNTDSQAIAEQLQLKELQQTGAAIVLIAGSQRVATVGPHFVRVGDKIDGYEVSNITAEGVILTKSRAR